MRKNFLIVVLAALSLTSACFGFPNEGDFLPDVTAFDEAGKQFPLREKLAGQPAVIVFGCLT